MIVRVYVAWLIHERVEMGRKIRREGHVSDCLEGLECFDEHSSVCVGRVLAWEISPVDLHRA